jgi:protein-S-isoprenylcysteine O-methyltransferase Ste14
MSQAVWTTTFVHFGSGFTFGFPIVLAVLSFFISLGIWFQSALVILWVLILFTPAFLFFVIVFEERELEFRIGASYLEHKSKTLMLFPRKPGVL